MILYLRATATALFLLLGLSSLQAEIYSFKKEPFSAIGDGETNDLPALEKALSTLKDGDTLIFPKGDYLFQLKKQAQLRVPSGVTLQGISGSTSFLLDFAGDKGHREFLRFQSHSAISGIHVKRSSAYPLVMFPLFGEIENVSITDCTIDGNKEKYPDGYCHILQVGIGSLSNLTMKRSTIMRASFGLFQTNSATGSLSEALFEQCLFESNYSSDLEFNSPRGKMSNITVRNCVFKDNRCKTASAGFAVGFANVKNSSVENCLISNYQSEALHVEDRSENIRLANNTITSGSTVQNNGIIMVLSDSKKVTIENNTIDARSNTNKTHLILITAGGNKFANPSENEVQNNILLHGPSTRTWYLQSGSTTKEEGNKIVEHQNTP